MPRHPPRAGPSLSHLVASQAGSGMATPVTISTPDRRDSQVQACPTQAGPSAAGSQASQSNICPLSTCDVQAPGMAPSDQASPLGTGQERVLTSELLS